MTCMEARETLLVADVEVLSGKGPEPLAAHLRECDRCRKLARTILAAEEGLGAALEAAPPPLPLDRVLVDSPRRGGRFRRGALAAVPLLAAAGIAALLFTAEPELPASRYSPPDPSAGLDVEVPEGRSAAVFDTRDPRITVLWIF